MESGERQDVAPQACSTCKKRKSRCDKILPSCSFSIVQGFIVPQIEFPAVFFLDHGVFERSSLVFPQDKSLVPLYIGSELGNHDQIRLIASRYFSSVHNWMPIVSKRLFSTTTMKLITWSPPPENPDPITQMYIAARQSLDSVDMSVTLTLTALQAAILIALYEIGHAIYPAAYLLGWKMAPRSTDNLSWTEMEERRRVWWAIRHITSEAPSDNDLLPVDDVAWDEGVPSTPGDINMGRFARLAQATHLLDRVLAHNKDSVMAVEFLDQETVHLDNALHSLMSFTIEEAD
ncbi:hypothetical protein N431DRAFT_491616 [Stipitochalara longipes BDJ]|nr:hypothetical protein N431DRAFT_491616 [Stipitochalara longipes BDJ]